MSPRMRLEINERAELVRRDGSVVGRVVSMTVELGGGGTTGGERTTSGDVNSTNSETSQEDGGVGEGQQTALVPDPVDDVWALYESLLRQRSRKPSPKERKWISEAIAACGVEQVMAAVRGLSASDHHRQGGYTGIEYAIRPKRDETVHGRVAKMAAKAPRNAPSDATLTVQDLLAPFTGYNRELVIGKMRDVQRGVLEPSEQNEKIAAEAERWLRETARIVVAERNGRKFVWGKAA